MPRPEDAARETIDAALVAAGWVLQDRDALNLDAARGVAVRHFPLRRGHGEADYLLFVDEQAVGVVEAKKVGTTLTGVEVQAEKYATGIPDHLEPPVRPLPFLYQSTGVETTDRSRAAQARHLSLSTSPRRWRIGFRRCPHPSVGASTRSRSSPRRGCGPRRCAPSTLR